MDILLTILIATLVLGFLVFIHEGGHFLAARAFGVRVSEFMIGLPGPSIGVTWKGTRFGVTAVPLWVCSGLWHGNGHAQSAPESGARLHVCTWHGRYGGCADALGITDDEAYQALEELTEWGSLKRPTRKDKLNTYRTPACLIDGVKHVEGAPREVTNLDEFFASEQKQQYCMLPFWKRITILLAGPFMNLLYA